MTKEQFKQLKPGDIIDGVGVGRYRVTGKSELRNDSYAGVPVFNITCVDDGSASFASMPEFWMLVSPVRRRASRVNPRRNITRSGRLAP